MFVIEDTIQINAPIARCFLLSTSIELVARTLGMTPVAGKTSGLIADRDRIEWRGWKFGLPQRHETLITAYSAPTYFQDTMASGRFRTFSHDHEFTQLTGQPNVQTLLKDSVRFTMPFGLAGRLAGRTILVPHIRSLVRRRFALLKSIAESESEVWRKYLPSA